MIVVIEVCVRIRGFAEKIKQSELGDLPIESSAIVSFCLYHIRSFWLHPCTIWFFELIFFLAAAAAVQLIVHSWQEKSACMHQEHTCKQLF
jgi:hypothetical protein